MNNLRITVLAENTAGKLGILAEHGLAFLIETGGEKILFDTGQGFVLKHNLEKLGLSLADVKTVVLSHGHYDHTGGLHTALAMMEHPKVYAHPAVIESKFVCYRQMESRSVAMPEADRNALLQQADWVRTEAPVELPGGLRLTGPVPRTTDFENTGGPFFCNVAGTEPDTLPDDQAAFVESENGTTVILGCAHSGVINTLQYIRSLTENRPIHTVIGGMHLHSASANRMNKTIKALRKLKIRCIFPCHCTGFDAAAQLWREFPGKVRPCPAGTVITLNERN
ncbi:MBL fold metallo-hydrolase [Tichowtungia aerotolerans]|uniref:MBL fold metallo-hydrolase n=1 Tax=Tichowtungia aerotolerans TaxID=2697043 RepID=A0A6P1MCX9_9BACT|nr:MBL fold metallo-hydrolase [Tichowtungia aerotolerans]QHI69456.1 MBL fold metallo-hydrolase [Tichowtungia aerotolerans]